MENQKNEFNWNNIDWGKYPCGISLFGKPIKEIKLSSREHSEEIVVSYWDGKKWQKIEN